ncbi:uncharacterized protein LOC127244136 isoform X2 [Andrographis paniculata]|uniref:uncharacterized protein LOC127244136 isoform X2 n=1 Tax=Andrographis paniculata TaxID=175694 RepID=UPI0021E73FE2|nr:uncharacterized protein LOC127244136 isoform X2 [Andrographis paniculata]
MKMDEKDSDSNPDWLYEKNRMEVLNQLSQEALRIAADAFPLVSPGSPDFSARITEGPPRHRRAHSEIIPSLHRNNSSSSNLQKWKSHMQRALNWGSQSFREDNRYSSFDPEILAYQKRQWYQLKSKARDQEKYKEPIKLFEHFVVVGLHPDAKLEAVEDAFIRRKKWEHEMRSAEVSDYNIRRRRPTFPTLEPEVLFQYPPRKKLTLNTKDLSAFCFPEGIKAHIVERTPSLSELNELVYGQGHMHRDDLSFIFSLKVADSATLYGVCLHVQEVVQKPPIVYGVAPLSQTKSRRSRFLMSAPRCYCILTRVPFFQLHYEMLNSIIAQERLNRITKFVTGVAAVDGALSHSMSKNHINANVDPPDNESDTNWMASAIPLESAGALAAAAAGIISDEDVSSGQELHSPGSAASDTSDHCQLRELDKDNKNLPASDESTSEPSGCQSSSGQTPDASPYICPGKQSPDCQSFESLFSPAGNMSSEGEDDPLYNNDEEFRDDIIMERARENKNDMLQIICKYHSMHLPERGSKIIFQPLEHLQSIEYQRPSISALGQDEKYIDCKLHNSEEASQVKLKLAAAEEAVTLSLWSTAALCRVLSLESVLALITGVLLEKQVIVQCPNLGILSAVVLSLNPIIRPFEWQSLFLPILPGKMLDFLDAPVPFIVGVQSKLADLKMKASNLVYVDVLENKVPRHKDLINQLRPIHSKLSYEDPLTKKHPAYKCSEVQAEAATQFLCVMRWYLESLCADLRMHTITSVQNNDKVALLLKDSFIESFPPRDQPFIKLFVETQLFTVLSDSRLSSYENE